MWECGWVWLNLQQSESGREKVEAAGVGRKKQTRNYLFIQNGRNDHLPNYIALVNLAGLTS